MGWWAFLGDSLFKATEQSLADYFSIFGNVKSMKIIRDDLAMSKGY